VPPLTPTESISILKDRLNQYIEENPSDFQGSIVFTGFDIIDLSTMKICFELNHRANFQDMKARKQRRTRFINKMQEEMKALGLITKIGPTELNVSLRE
jgi:hypothetical protein